MAGIPLTVTTNGAGAGGMPTQSDQLQDPSNLNAINGTTPGGNSTMASNTTTTTTTPSYDDVEGSGDEYYDESSEDTANTKKTSATNTNTAPNEANKENEDDEDDDDTDLTSLFSIGSFITRAALFKRSIRSAEPRRRQSKQFYSTCDDRITLPCIVEDFISVGGSNSVTGCSPVHCGNSLCPRGVSPCRVESTVTPFGIGIHFGDGLGKGSPEENIGACMRFKQLNCA